MSIFKFIILLISICNFIPLMGQGWVTLKDSVAWGVNVYKDTQDNYIILTAGNIILNFDKVGNFVSEYHIDDFVTKSLFYTSNKEFLLLQTDQSESPNNAIATLLGTDKEIQWEYQLDYLHNPNSSGPQRTRALDAIQNEHGDYFVFGDIEDATQLELDYRPFLIKLNANGEEQWFQTYCNTLPPLEGGFQFSMDIKKSTDGGFVLMTHLNGVLQDTYPGFTKVNAEGEMEWKQYFYHNLMMPQHNGIEHIIETSSSNMVITEAGEIVTAGMSRPNGEYIGIPYLMTLNLDGSLQSFLPLDIPFNQEYYLNIEIKDIQKYGEDFVLLYDGIVGERRSTGIVIVNKEGDILLNKFLKNGHFPNSTKIMVLEEGGFAIIGGGQTLVLIKTDSLGNCYPNTQFSTSDSGLGFYQFDNQSEYADSYLWEFGDGNTDTTSIVSHQYQATGTYEVCLTATNLCDSFTKCKNIEVSEVTDIEVHEWEQGLLVYPNPLYNTDLFVNIPQSTNKPNLMLYNSLGKQLINQHSNSLEVSELEAGIYYLQIQIGEEATTRKIVVY